LELSMNATDREPLVAIALLASLADGQSTAEEKKALQSLVGQMGLGELDAMAARISSGEVVLAQVVTQLSSDEARRTAYETALLVVKADGTATVEETAFLADLRARLGLSAADVAALENSSNAVANAGATPPASTATASSSQSAPGTSPPGLDDLILQQAKIAAACELLPDRLASMAILPLQLRLVYRIGQAHGMQLDMNQVTDLAGTLGIGAAAQVVERVVRRVFGGVGSGIFGGLLGGAAGIASGAAVTFASTYALGHVAKQYYAQGRKLSQADMRALFARFQSEAQTLFPKVQEQVQSQAAQLDLPKLLSGFKGA
jgi:uncharacterized protein (DUF697 family)/tellurite resistance protein